MNLINPRPRRALLLAALTALLPLGTGGWAAASAETVLEQAAKTGEVLMVGPTNTPPLISVSAQGEPQGYAIDVARRIDRELQLALGSKVQIRFVPTDNGAEAVQAVSGGRAGLACGVPFSWEIEKLVDFSLPIGLSGLRLLTRSGTLDGSPASLAGRQVAVVYGSVGARTLAGLQPKAKAVTYPTLLQAVTALEQKKVDGVLGDTNLLAGLRQQRKLPGLKLVPDQPYLSYGLGCIVPENNSSLLNVVNVAIAKLFQGYLEGRPDAVATVDAWVGKQGALGVPPERIRVFFGSVLQGREGIILVTPSPAAPR
ncbi:extracellular substrate binding-like orphan protein GrrP [Cyanobium sp. WAJ14-Wanaka]|uniref:extracellular substrate binding-like orphan protein GrrP n=1 Tax=Cyanobium sp. WAJ14-Wanaka TaxID=2823725 RepID=UPI0020CD5A3C|nr:extracellular substrate binding-like orphan protein GrrP [Cyanobium sp. WAJ14-Wanaka]